MSEHQKLEGSFINENSVGDGTETPAWRKSSRCGTSTCVEGRYNPETDMIEVRDSKNVGGVALSFTLEEWDSFVGGAKGGEFDTEVMKQQALGGVSVAGQVEATPALQPTTLAPVL